MFDFIERVRQKPERAKKQIAFFAAFSLVLVMFVVWVTVIFPNWKDSQTREAQADSLQPSPTGAFFETLKSGFSGIHDGVAKIKDAVSAFSQGVSYYSASTSAAETANAQSSEDISQ